MKNVRILMMVLISLFLIPSVFAPEEVGDKVVCGDSICSVGEDEKTCIEDCNHGCGDGVCDSKTEDDKLCPSDCYKEPTAPFVDYVSSRGPNYDIIKTSTGFKQQIYMGNVNMLHDGKYIPIEEFINISNDKGKIKIKDLDGNECYITLDYSLNDKLASASPTLNIVKNRGSYYFTTDVGKAVDTMKYNFSCNTSFSNDKLTILDNIEIDFKQAKEQQNISTSLNPTTKQLEFSAVSGKIADLKMIDPIVTYNFSSTYENINMWAYATTTNYKESFPPHYPIPTTNVSDITLNAGLNNIDGTRVSASADTTSDWATFYIKSNINYPSSDITKINLTSWNHYNSLTGTKSFTIAFYNFTGSVWVNETPTTISATKKGNISYAISSSNNISDFINSSDIFVASIAVNSGDDQEVDYITLEITYDGLVINSPTSSQEILNTLSTTLNTSQSGYNQSVWYTYNSGRTNITLCTLSNECQGTITFPRQGYYNLTVYGNKTDGTITSKTVQNLFVGNETFFDSSNKVQFLESDSCIDEPPPDDGPYPSCDTTLTDITTDTDFDALDSNFEQTFDSSNFLEMVINATETQNIKNMIFSYTGKASGSGRPIKLYIWDGVLWSYLTTITGTTSLTINNQTNNISYINSTKFIHYIVQSGSSSTSVYTDYFSSNITYYTPNTAPTITLTTSNYTNYTSTQSVNLTFNISDDMDYLTNISLYLDGALTSTIQNPTINTSIQNPFNFTLGIKSAGNYTYYIKAYDSDGLSNTSETRMFHVNAVPIINSINLNVSEPADTEDINCTTTHSDADGNSVSITYDWYKNTVAQTINNSYLGNGNTSIGEYWYCSAVPFDGIENGTMATSGSVGIQTGTAPPSALIANATTHLTNINSSVTNPTNNNTLVNFSVSFTDGEDKWTAYFCKTNSFDGSTCAGGNWGISAINSTNKYLSATLDISSLGESSYNFYTFVADNTSLYSSGTVGTFNVNHYPSTPSLSQIANTSLNYTLIQFSATDSDSDVINYTIFNSTDGITYSNSFNGTAYNWTNLKEGTYYLKAQSKDQHNYSNYLNSSVITFLVDTTAPVLSAITASATSMYTTGTVTLSANSTDALTYSSTCIFTVVDTTLTTTNYSTTKSGNTFTKVLSSATAGTLQFTAVYCNDSVGNMAVNSSVNLNVSVTVYSAPSTPPAGGGGDPDECTISSDCNKYGTGYTCVSKKCVFNMSLIPLAFTSCNYNGLCEADLGESWINCRCSVGDSCGNLEVESGDCTFSFSNLFAKQAGQPSAAKFLVWITAISVGLLIIFLIMKVVANKRTFVKLRRF